MRNPRRRFNPNEDPEYMEELKRSHPQHTVKDWIWEALRVNNKHCSDGAIIISNLLYVALNNVQANRPDKP